MPNTLSQMSLEELAQFVEAIVKKAVREELRAFLDDPDKGLDLKEDILDKITYQAELTSRGERGRALRELMSEIDMDDDDL